MLALIAFVYWPVAHAGFVWDDIGDFEGMGWLRHGNDWMHLLFSRFNDWVAYFRPLGVLLFTVEIRAFDTSASAMHLVSLALHLINTALVGRVALLLLRSIEPRHVRVWSAPAVMLLYGVHPVLVEPVVWIGCQFEQLVVLFMLLGWLANLNLKNAAARAVTVGLCFLLAAFAKESALSFAPILLLLDWYRLLPPASNAAHRLRAMLRTNGYTYAAILLAGLIYLLIRWKALGALVPPNGPVHPFWMRLQETSTVYLRYWRMLFWPATDAGPIHNLDKVYYSPASFTTIWQMLASALIVLTGIWLVLKRHYLGAIIIGFSLALFPVLHILAANFDSSPYHERYAMAGWAIVCVWLPLWLSSLNTSRWLRGSAGPMVVVLLFGWALASSVMIRATAPLWSNDLRLWTWAYQEYPQDVDVLDKLIAAEIRINQFQVAWLLIRQAEALHLSCDTCFLNAANVALAQRNTVLADHYLKLVRDSPTLYANATFYRLYLSTIGALELAQGRPQQAEALERKAMSTDPLDPDPIELLALALLNQGRFDEATQVGLHAISLLPEAKRASALAQFQAQVAAAKKHHQTVAPDASTTTAQPPSMATPITRATSQN